MRHGCVYDPYAYVRRSRPTWQSVLYLAYLFTMLSAVVATAAWTVQR